MKIQSKFKIRTVCGQHVVVNQGQSSSDMTQLISLNDTAVAIWNALSGKEFTLSDVAAFLQNTYKIDEALAQKDAAAWVESLKSCQVIA